jgi:co-chaperonin GroES (HSP10)
MSAELNARGINTLGEAANTTAFEKNDRINLLVQDLYAQHRSVLPMHPWVLVYVLPREQKLGKLFLPGSQQKVTLEGIVLSTWAQWTEERGFRENGVEKTRIVVHKSELSIGDHVLFPHWSGLPIPGMDETKFRVVKELGWSKNEEGGIYGVVEYSEPDTSANAKLRELLADGLLYCTKSPGTPGVGELPGLIAAKIEEQFLLVDRTRAGVTLSALHGKT